MTQLGVVHILDANLLLRLADVNHSHHATALNAVNALRTGGAVLRTVPQAIYEFWTVATRATQVNGLGFTVPEAERLINLFSRVYWPVPDDPSTLAFWRQLVVKHQIVGKPSHDAKYIASMQAHGISHILTFDAGFNRYSGDGIIVVNPTNITVKPQS